MERVKSPWIIAFGVVAVLHLLFVGVGAAPADTITKCLLAPLLAAWAWQLGGPKLLLVALAFCFLGDLFMDLDRFLWGMAAFALAHVCFITLFGQRGALNAIRASFGGQDRWRAAFVVAYALAAVLVIAWAWGGFDPAMRTAVPVYATLLVGTAATAMALDVRAGVGAALFVVSDMLIALGAAGRIDPDATSNHLAVMGLYIFGILLITGGVLNRELRTQRLLRDGTDLTQRTDCWPRLPS